MQSPQAKLKEIHRLLGSWPSQATGDGEEQLRSYLLAAEDYPAGDVEAACTALIKGVAPGVNPNFLPPPAAFGAECRRQLNLRLDHEARVKPPALPPPDIPKTPENKAKVAALVEEVAERFKAETAEATGRHRAQMSKANRFFDDERGFSVGDEIGHNDAA